VLSTLERWVQGRADAPELLQPHITLWFDLAPEIAAQRLAGARLPDKFESQPVEFFRRVAAGYAARAAADAERFVRIDASQTRDQVWQQVETALVARGALAPASGASP
jgi:dTMP kinase